MNNTLKPTRNSTSHTARPQLQELGLNQKNRQTNKKQTRDGTYQNVQQTGQGTRQKSHEYTKRFEAMDIYWVKYSGFLKGDDIEDLGKSFGRRG